MERRHLNTISLPLKEWVTFMIKNKPRLFGSDGGSNAISRAYLEAYLGSEVEITDEMLKGFRCVERLKNKFLENNPEYDSRVNEAPKKKRR